MTTAAGPVIRHTLLAVTNAPASVAEAVAVREALEVLVDVDAAEHRTPADISALRKPLLHVRAAAGQGRTKVLLANSDLLERYKTHAELVDGIVAGDVARTQTAIDRHVGRPSQ